MSSSTFNEPGLAYPSLPSDVCTSTIRLVYCSTASVSHRYVRRAARVVLDDERLRGLGLLVGVRTGRCVSAGPWFRRPQILVEKWVCRASIRIISRGRHVSLSRRGGASVGIWCMRLSVADALVKMHDVRRPAPAAATQPSLVWMPAIGSNLFECLRESFVERAGRRFFVQWRDQSWRYRPRHRKYAASLARRGHWRHLRFASSCVRRP